MVMRSEIGAMTLDQSLKERATLNVRITHAVNSATADWGVQVMRCTSPTHPFIYSQFPYFPIFLLSLILALWNDANDDDLTLKS